MTNKNLIADFNKTFPSLADLHAQKGFLGTREMIISYILEKIALARQEVLKEVMECKPAYAFTSYQNTTEGNQAKHENMLYNEALNHWEQNIKEQIK